MRFNLESYSLNKFVRYVTSICYFKQFLRAIKFLVDVMQKIFKLKFSDIIAIIYSSNVRKCVRNCYLTGDLISYYRSESMY